MSMFLRIATCMIAIALFFCACAESNVYYDDESQINYLKEPDGEAFASIRYTENRMIINVDSSGKYYFADPEGKIIDFGFEVNDWSIKSYGLLLNQHLLLDDDNNILFDYDDLGEYELYSTQCLDAGFILITRSVNTFAETATYTYAMNIKTGEVLQLDTLIPPEYAKGANGWLYFGEGYYLYCPGHGGFGGEMTFLNLNDGSIYTGLNENGETKLPDYQFFKSYDIRDVKMYYADSTDLMILDAKTGHLTRRPYTDFIIDSKEDYQSITFNETANELYLYKCTALTNDGKSEPCLLDINTGILTPMGIFASYSVIAHNARGEYLLYVTNEGGGKFVASIDAQGNLLFDPLVQNHGVYNSSENYFTYKDENDRFQLYRWDGKPMLDEPQDIRNNDIIFGKESAMIKMSDDSIALFKADGSVQVLSITLDPDVKPRGIEWDGCFLIKWWYNRVPLAVTEEGRYIKLESNTIHE